MAMSDILDEARESLSRWERILAHRCELLDELSITMVSDLDRYGNSPPIIEEIVKLTAGNNDILIRIDQLKQMINSLENFKGI